MHVHTCISACVMSWWTGAVEAALHALEQPARAPRESSLGFHIDDIDVVGGFYMFLYNTWFIHIYNLFTWPTAHLFPESLSLHGIIPGDHDILGIGLIFSGNEAPILQMSALDTLAVIGKGNKLVINVALPDDCWVIMPFSWAAGSHARQGERELCRFDLGIYGSQIGHWSAHKIDQNCWLWEFSSVFFLPPISNGFPQLLCICIIWSALRTFSTNKGNFYPLPDPEDIATLVCSVCSPHRDTCLKMLVCVESVVVPLNGWVKFQPHIWLKMCQSLIRSPHSADMLEKGSDFGWVLLTCPAHFLQT